MKRFWPVLLLFLLPIVPLWRCVFLGEAIGPFDQIRQMTPWHGSPPAQPWDVLQADGVLQFYPWRDLVLNSWAKGQMPLWNPYELAGTPLLANSQSAGFYPPHVLLGLLHFPTGPAMVVLAWLHLFWAGLGVYLLTRRLGASKLGAAVAGSSFELSAFMLAWTGLPSVITTVAWIPWALAATVALFDSLRGRSFALLAFSLGMMVLAGHLQFVAYGFMAVVLTAAVMAATARRAKPLGGVLVACFVGILFATPQLLPVLNNSKFSHRRVTASEAGYEAYISSAIKPFELGNLIYPYSLGSPRKAVEAEGPPISEYWPAVAKQGGNLAESAVTIGPFVLGLLFLVPWRDRRTWPMAAVGVLALLLALGTILNKPLYFLLPGWSSTGSPGRIVVLFVLACCVLAGLGFDSKALAKVKSPAVLATVAPLLLLLLLVPFATSAGLAAANPQLHDVVAQIQAAAAPGLVTSIAVALLGGVGLAILLLEKTGKFRRQLIAVPILVALTFSTSLIMTGKPLTPVANAPTAARVAIVNSGWDLLVAAPALLPPNTPSLSRIHELAGYDSLLHGETKSLLDDINGQDSAPPANGNMMFVKPTLDPAKASAAGVTQIWSSRDMPSLGAAEVEDGFFKYLLAGPGVVSVDGGTAKVVRQDLSSTEVEATGPGRLVFRDRMMPGWSATIDGSPAPMSDGLWKELDLGGGTHQVRFSYSPPGMTLGFGLAFVAIAAMIAAILADRRLKAPTAEPQAATGRLPV